MSETTTPLAVPTVHLNGTSRRELLEQICTALTALQAATQYSITADRLTLRNDEGAVQVGLLPATADQSGSI